MGINLSAVKKVLKSADQVFVQYDTNGGFVEVCDGCFVARMTPEEYTKNGFVSATGTGLPNDKTMCLAKRGKKAEYEFTTRLKTEQMTTIEAAERVNVSATRVYWRTDVGQFARIYKTEDGKAIYMAEKYADIIEGCEALTASRKYGGPISYCEHGIVKALLLPVRADFSELCKELDYTPAPVEKPKPEEKPETAPETEETAEVEEVAEVEDEPLEAPVSDATEDACEEAEEAVDEIPEEPTEEVTEKVDELDDIDNLDEVKAVEGEEPADEIDGWKVPEEVFVITKPNGTTWAYGKTKPIKDELKRRNFHYAPKWQGAKKAGYPRSGWYRKPEMVAVAAAD